MGSSQSRINERCCHDDIHPILGDCYLSEYPSETSFQGQRAAVSPSPLVYCSCKARLLNEYGRSKSSGELELSHGALIYKYTERNVQKVVQWPLDGLRGYGFRKHLFTFEAGRRCSMPGTFVFKCKRAHFLHSILRELVNSIAQGTPRNTSCSCRSRLNQERYQPRMDFLPESPAAPNVRQSPVPPPLLQTTTTTNRHHHHRLDEYIYLSRTTLPPSPPNGMRVTASDPSLTSPGSGGGSSVGGGGVYLIAMPYLSSSSLHSYENQCGFGTA